MLPPFSQLPYHKAARLNTLQAQTSYQKMLNLIPDTAKLPIVDLKTGNVTMMDFSKKM